MPTLTTSFMHITAASALFLLPGQRGNRINPQQYIIGTDHFKKMSQELRFASPADNPFRVIAGAFYQRQSNQIHQDYMIDNLEPALSVNGFPGTLWLTQQKRVDKDYAVFGEASFDITPKITVTGGWPLLQVRQYADRFLRLRPQSGEIDGDGRLGHSAECRGQQPTGVAQCWTASGDTLRDRDPNDGAPDAAAGGRCGQPVHQSRRFRERQAGAEARQGPRLHPSAQRDVEAARRV